MTGVFGYLNNLVTMNYARLKISWIMEPMAALNSPAASSSFCRESKDVLFDVNSTFIYIIIVCYDFFSMPD